MPDMIIPHSYLSPIWAMAVIANGGEIASSEANLACWVPSPVPPIAGGVLDILGCLDADHTQ